MTATKTVSRGTATKTRPRICSFPTIRITEDKNSAGVRTGQFLYLCINIIKSVPIFYSKFLTEITVIIISVDIHGGTTEVVCYQHVFSFITDKYHFIGVDTEINGNIAKSIYVRLTLSARG